MSHVEEKQSKKGQISTPTACSAGLVGCRVQQLLRSVSKAGCGSLLCTHLEPWPLQSRSWAHTGMLLQHPQASGEASHCTGC